MQDEKWQEILGKVKDSFEVLEHRTIDLEPGPGTLEFIIFIGPLGKIKLARTTRPLVLDKKAHGSRRIGSQTSVEYIYSETEKTHAFMAFKWDEDQQDWIKIEAGNTFSL